MAGIFRARPACITPLLHRFLKCEDEYISERVLVAAYGAFLLNPSKSDLHDAAIEIYDQYFDESIPPLNASLRGHGRLIIDMAHELGVTPTELKTESHVPPYSSPWPLQLPTEDEVRALAEDRERFPQMSLVQQMGLATGTDFARYVVEPRVTDSFDIKEAGLDKLGVFRWFLKSAKELGYPGPQDQCAIFDWSLLTKFGGGRGKPGWAERLGKKYYWIFLRQLIGTLGDHANRKTWTGSFPPSDEIQGLDVRDIDPSDLRQFLDRDGASDEWLTPASYVFKGKDDENGDAAWVAEADLPDIADSLLFTDPEGAKWHSLDIPLARRAD